MKHDRGTRNVPWPPWIWFPAFAFLSTHNASYRTLPVDGTAVHEFSEAPPLAGRGAQIAASMGVSLSVGMGRHIAYHKPLESSAVRDRSCYGDGGYHLKRAEEWSTTKPWRWTLPEATGLRATERARSLHR
jgi:hypothetical protein